jgi:uncharacterized membrane protein YeaQ/YmgE (transglycosylase-associated protein family)
MNIVALVIQLISGAVGGNIAGAILKKYNLGPIGNSIVGLIGGGVGGQLLSLLTSGGVAGSGRISGWDGYVLDSVQHRRGWRGRRRCNGHCRTDQGADVQGVIAYSTTAS